MRIIASAGQSGPVASLDPKRPEEVDAGAWRRFSRLARLAAGPLAQVLPAAASDLPLFFGTGVGEYTSSVAFLRSVYLKGPPSPLAFQNSVHNAAAGHLSIAFGLRGASETLAGGPDTGAIIALRVEAYLAVHGGRALLVVGDDLCPEAVLGWPMGGEFRPLGEGAAAFLVEAGKGELPVAVSEFWFPTADVVAGALATS